MFWQQLVLPKVIGYSFHLIDTLLIVLAVAMEFVRDCYNDYCGQIWFALSTWNAVVVGIYGMIALGEVSNETKSICMVCFQKDKPRFVQRVEGIPAEEGKV